MGIDALAGWETELSVTTTTGEYVGGRWEENTPTTYTTPGFVRPASPRDLQLLPEGLRETEAISIITLVELMPLREEGNPTGRGDVVTYNGRNYRVRSSTRWGESSMPDIGPLVHYRALAVLE